MTESTLSQNFSNTKGGGGRLGWGEADAMNAEPVTDLEEEEQLDRAGEETQSCNCVLTPSIS